ncbi:sperm-associated antigen 8 isoform X1 [Manis javanica]|uniref:sperm-associated antigen 8 isoform X1 n=1 Tax=Manis javanica TaxID=9974 RepID=UPI003C6CD7AB|nr:Sperm-associated antigen 8 [Manis javanica]
METTESTEESQLRSLDVQPNSDGLGFTSEPFTSDSGPRSALRAAARAAAAAAAASATATTAKAAALATKTPAVYAEPSLLTAPFSNTLFGDPCTRPSLTHRIGHGRLGFEPVYVSCLAQDPCTTHDISSSSGPGHGYGRGTCSDSGSGPGHGYGRGTCSDSGSGPDRGSSPGHGYGQGTNSDSGPGPGRGSGPGHGYGQGTGSDSGSGPARGSGPGHGYGQGTGSDSASGPDHSFGQGTGPDSGPGPVPDSRPSPGCDHDPELSPYALSCCRNPRTDLIPNCVSWSHYGHWDTQKQPPWKFLQVSEPGARGLWKPHKVEGKCKILSETLPRGQCLLYNWEEERATNHLDQVPSMQDGSESFFFRHGHQGLLTMHLQSPMSFSTTQKDSYRPPGKHYQPVRGKREAMLEMLLHHQICKEVRSEQEPTRNHFEVESVTHHDYQKELVQAGPPAPTKPHDYCQEQPETFWIQRAPQLPGVSNIKTLDTPFRKNCSFSTPVPLSLGQPLSYEPETHSPQLGEISSLACQGGGGGRNTPV